MGHGSVREVYSNFHNLNSTIWIAILYMHGPLQQKGIDNLSTIDGNVYMRIICPICNNKEHVYVHVYRCACPLWSSGFLSTPNFHEHARNYLSTHVLFSSDSFEHTQFSRAQLAFCHC